MSLTTILLIAVPIVLMLLMHSVGHGGHMRGRASHGEEHDQVGGTRAVDRPKADGREQGPQHGRRGGCC